jgi:hypothetical protein
MVYFRPEPGQLWIDNDPRNRATRYVRVDGLRPDDVPQYNVALVTTWYDEPGGVLAAHSGTIKIARFRPIRTGYRLADVEPEHGLPEER